MKNRWVKLIALLVTVILMFTAIGCKRDNDAATGDGVTGSAETYATKSTDGTWGVDSLSLPEARSYSWNKYPNSNKDGAPKGSKLDAFNEKFVNWPFFSSEDDIVTYAMNSMYYNYGYLSAANQPYVGLGVGWAPAWWEWMSLTHNFSDNGTTKAKWRQYCVNVPCYGPSSGTNNHDSQGRGTSPRQNSGYIWSYDTAHWPNMGFGDTCGNYHYDSNFCYLITVMNYCMWENSLDMLSEVDTDKTLAAESKHHVHEADDASQGMTVATKFNLALNYVLQRLGGKNGMICIDVNCNDGRNLGGWPSNTGTDLAYSCNYWDNVPVGYKDAYTNIYFYQVLMMLQDFCKMGWTVNNSAVQTNITNAVSGNLTYDLSKVSSASQCQTLANTVKNSINANFWQTTNKRYIACIDNENVYRDYGMTYISTQALTYGIADTRTKATAVYQWLDGTREISGDKSKGTSVQKSPITGKNVERSDIYAYGGYSSGTTLTASCTPRSNTVDFGGGDKVWFHTNNGSQSTSENGIFGGHLENGGAILFTLYYDIMGRLNYYVGSGDNCESAMEKLLYVAKDYAVDELNRDPRNGVSQSNDVIGYVGEYSENGVAPTCYLYGIVGLNVGGGELKLDPHIPSNYSYVGARDIVYGNGTYEFTVFANGKVIVEGANSMNLKLNMKDWANCGSVIVRIYNEFDQIVKETKVTVSGGRFMADLTNGGAGYSGNTYAVIEKA